MMEENLRIGSKYRSVKLHTTYSFGLDDQEFVVVFETDKPADFLDLFPGTARNQSELLHLRDTPMFTCRKRSLSECLDAPGLKPPRHQPRQPKDPCQTKNILYRLSAIGLILIGAVIELRLQGRLWACYLFEDSF